MKKILFIIMIIGLVFAQDAFNAYETKQPKNLRQSAFELITDFLPTETVYETEQVWVATSDTTGYYETDTTNIIPAYSQITYKVVYHGYFVDDEGNLLQSKAFHGNMLPHITNAEAQGLKSFVDKYNNALKTHFIK